MAAVNGFSMTQINFKSGGNLKNNQDQSFFQEAKKQGNNEEISKGDIVKMLLQMVLMLMIQSLMKEARDGQNQGGQDNSRVSKSSEGPKEMIMALLDVIKQFMGVDKGAQKREQNLFQKNGIEITQIRVA